MTMTILTAGLLALGALAASGAAQARQPAFLYGQQSQAGSVVPYGGSGINGLRCRDCLKYRTPLPGETVILNPQPLPPKAALLRR